MNKNENIYFLKFIAYFNNIFKNYYYLKIKNGT